MFNQLVIITYRAIVKNLVVKRTVEYTDEELVRGILNNDPIIIEYFFIKKCSNMLVYILNSVFSGHIDKTELVNELFLFLANDNWRKLRNFNYNSSLMTWITVVATRFFIRKRDKLIENESSEALIIESDKLCHGLISEDSVNLHMAIEAMPNERYQRVIQLLDMQEVSYEDAATELNVSVANLYNIHRRAIAQLRYILTV